MLILRDPVFEFLFIGLLMLDFLLCRVVEILEFLGFMLKGFDLSLKLIYFR